MAGVLALGALAGGGGDQGLEGVCRHGFHRLAVEVAARVDVHLATEQLVPPRGRGDLQRRHEGKIGDRTVAGDEEEQVASGADLTGDGTVDGGDHKSYFSIFNNYYKPGPATPHTPISYRLLKPESERSRTVVNHFGIAYVEGNVVEGNEKVTKDNWDGGVQPDVKQEPLDVALAAIRTNKPYAHAPLPIESAVNAYKEVLANAGATLPKRDAVDLRVIKMVRTGKTTAKPETDTRKQLIQRPYTEKNIDEQIALIGKGIITNPSQVGGYPDYQGETYTDYDGDGMPDAWEIAHGLNPNVPNSNGDFDNDGYTDLEEYLNEIGRASCRERV